MFLQSTICAIVTRSNINFFFFFLKLSIALNSSENIWERCIDSSQVSSSLSPHIWMNVVFLLLT